mgnify:CR=1 FL=1
MPKYIIIKNREQDLNDLSSPHSQWLIGELQSDQVIDYYNTVCYCTSFLVALAMYNMLTKSCDG